MVGCGKCMSSYRINIPTSPRPSALSTAYSIPTSMKCTCPIFAHLTPLQERLRLSRRHQPNLVTDVRYLFHNTPANLIIDMINIFEVFLPQLLRYPNPADP